MRRTRAVLVGLALVLAACSGHSGAHGDVQLTIRVADVPAGHTAAVVVTGPHSYQARLTRTTMLSVPAGRYRVTTSGVRVGADTFYPQDLVQEVTPPAQVLVDFAEQVPDTTKALDAAHLGLAPGTNADGAVLTFVPGSAGARVHAGDVIVVGPGRQTPHGLLRKVVSVSRSTGAVRVRVAPAELRDAVARGALHARLRVDPTASLGLGSGGAACGEGAKFSGTASAGASGWVDFDFDWGFATPNYVKLVGGVSETADASLTVAKVGYCKVSRDSPGMKLPNFPLPLGPVTLTVTPELVAHGEASGTFTVGPSYGFHETGWAKAGFTWGTPDGSNQDLHPIFGAGATFTGTPPKESPEENLWAGAGPQVNFDIDGLDGGPYVNFLGGMTIDNKQQSDGSTHYTVSGDSKLNVGFRANWGPLNFSISEPFTLTSKKLYEGSYGPSNGSTSSTNDTSSGMIVFSCGRWDSSICEMNPDGSSVRTVKACRNPATEAGCAHPVLSPDGTRLAYEGPEGTLAITSVDGTKDYSPPDQYPGFGSFPTWSPRGDKLAFVSCAPPPCALDVVNADGTGLRTVFRAALISPTAGPAWSPDGGELAFATQPKGTPLPSGDVDVVPTTTGTTVAPHPLVTHLLDGATSLSWAPGHALLFTSGHEPGIVQADMSGWPTDPGSFAGHLVASCGTCVDFGPSWAPDGLHFSFVRNGRVAIATPDRGVEAIIGPRPVSFAQWGGGAA